MNIIHRTACLSLLSVIAACAPAGYYDSNGDYRSYGESDTFRHEHAMSGTPTSEYTANNGQTTIIYERRGYYDYNGNYIVADNAPRVPAELFPPHGMCRVWFMDRAAEDQPAPESCKDIKARVPEGAYVIYGG